jgi:hypothetical protein
MLDTHINIGLSDYKSEFDFISSDTTQICQHHYVDVYHICINCAERISLVKILSKYIFNRKLNSFVLKRHE